MLSPKWESLESTPPRASERGLFSCRTRSCWLRLQMKLEPRQQLPNTTINIRHFLGGFDHVLQSGLIERLADAELQTFSTFDNSHRLRMCNLTGGIGEVHAMIEFVAQGSGSIESIDQFGQRLVELLVPEVDFR